ncbi:hypothetical protein AB3X94_37115 [Paraburkholderia sp. BR10923]|uniref:DUF7694 domain-containing protein n=1 Tax=Paraburkholderia sp. BR10923 TaxID=3236992 RepID=UPI0034CD4345
MRSLNFLNRWRVPLYGDAGDQYHGAFKLRIRPTTTRIWVIAGCGDGWEHVSVSIANEKRLPTWPEMAYVKALFFDPEETVMQLHPPLSEYVNNAEVLHLWRPQGETIPLPPRWMVGIPGATPSDMPRIMTALRHGF